MAQSPSSHAAFRKVFDDNHDAVHMFCLRRLNIEDANEATADVRNQGSLEVPIHLRNAPTQLMKQLDHGKHYRYAHDEPDAYAAGEHYFPDDMPERIYYQPVDRGLEIRIREKLERLRAMDRNARNEGD